MATIDVVLVSGRPDHILRCLHGSVSRFLQKFADKGTIFEGLSIAGRRLQLSSRSKRRLRELDAVAAWLKYASDERSSLFMEDLAQELRTRVGVAHYSTIASTVVSSLEKESDIADSAQGDCPVPDAVDPAGTKRRATLSGPHPVRAAGKARQEVLTTFRCCRQRQRQPHVHRYSHKQNSLPMPTCLKRASWRRTSNYLNSSAIKGARKGITMHFATGTCFSSTRVSSAR